MKAVLLQSKGIKLRLQFEPGNFKFVGLTRYRKQNKNNQQAGGIIMRPPAIFYACKCHFSKGVHLTLFEHP